MNKKLFVVSVLILTLLASFFWAGGAKPALAETTTLADAAGIAAYVNVGPIADLDIYKPAFQSIEYVGSDFFIGLVDAFGYTDEYDPYVLVHASGLIIAYYPAGDPAGKAVDVIARTTNKTLLEKALETVVGTPVVASFYDFDQTDATTLLLVAEYQADGDSFTLNIPSTITYAEKSYGFYRYYEPSFTLDNDLIEQVNFVLTNADYFNPIVYGTIYGHFGDVGEVNINTDTDYTFTVWNRDFYAFGALALVYSGTDPIVVGDADFVRTIPLVAPTLPDMEFDYTPSAPDKIAPIDLATNIGLAPTLNWEASTAPNYEYCIETDNVDVDLDGDLCDTGWESTTATSVALSNLFFDTTYYWQVRAFNTTDTVYADGGNWFSFTTAVRVNPVDFAKIDGVLAQPVGGTIKLTMTWEPSYGAYYFEYCVDTTPDCVAPELWHNVGLATTATVSDLLLNTTYYWQVRAANYNADEVVYYTYADEGIWSDAITTRTFSKINPPDLAVYDISKPLMWEATPNALSYEYCYDTTINAACDGTWKNTKLVTQASFKKLSAGEYEWQVRAVISAGSTPDHEYANGGDWWTFTVLAKSSKITLFKVSPLNGAIDQQTSVILTWKSTKIVGGYEYCYFPIDDTDTTPIADDDTCTGSTTNWVENTDTDVTINNLDNATTYYWQVRANIGTATDPVYIYADKGDFWAFTTAIVQ